MRMREKHHDFFICFKILVVKRFKIDNGGVLTLVQDRDPAGDAAVTAGAVWPAVGSDHAQFYK